MEHVGGNKTGGMRRASRILVVVAIALVAGHAELVSAATRFWTGASITQSGVPHDNFWTNPFNWQGTVVPSPGDDLVLIGGTQAASVNTFSPGTAFNSITISSHVAQGNAI